MNIACDGNVAYFSYEYVSLPHWYYELKDKDYYDEIYKNRELEDAMMSTMMKYIKIENLKML